MAHLARSVLVHGFVFLLAVVVFYTGIGVGLAASSVPGSALIILALVIAVGNVVWILRRLMKR